MAKQSMLKFVQVDRDMPPKRDAGVRREDFGEIYADYAEAKAAEQASRCSQCGVPYCQSHCPLHNNIPDWLRLTAEGRLKEAYEISQATNTFPEICGRICPQDRLCEGNCVIELSGHGTLMGWNEDYIPKEEDFSLIGTKRKQTALRIMASAKEIAVKANEDNNLSLLSEPIKPIEISSGLGKSLADKKRIN